MTIRPIAPYRTRLVDALKRIVDSVGLLTKIFSRAKAIDNPIVDGHPQIVRDIEFIAEEVEGIAHTAARKVILEDPPAP